MDSQGKFNNSEIFSGLPPVSLISINQNNFAKSQFSFRKKKGRIFVDYNESKAWFSYYYKDDSYIDLVTKLRIETGTWEVNASNRLMLLLPKPIKESTQIVVIVGDRWDIVVKHLKTWLQQFK